MSEERYSDRVSAKISDGIRRGLRGESECVVTDAMTTAHVGGRQRVMTTPAMIMQMEETAQEVTRPFLPVDHTTVGYEICVRHRRPTPIGETFVSRAELLEVDGRKLLFRVEAHNSRELIGEGTVRRTIVRQGSLG